MLHSVRNVWWSFCAWCVVPECLGLTWVAFRVILFAGMPLGVVWIKEINQCSSDSSGENSPGCCCCAGTQQTEHCWSAEGEMKSVSQRRMMKNE